MHARGFRLLYHTFRMADSPLHARDLIEYCAADRLTKLNESYQARLLDEKVAAV